ncbi:alpha/beta hydrolase family protein [Gordonia sp. CPCC 205333]|uniref:alpha/beta hydrolase family protein n=1 Tax=Gordonia sp. CPCC 205333 TaxID=3140790 RepID=UPI003AF3D509
MGLPGQLRFLVWSSRQVLDSWGEGRWMRRVVVGCIVAIGLCACAATPTTEGIPSSTLTPVKVGPWAADLNNVNESSDVEVRRYLYPTSTGSRDERQNWADVYLPPGQHKSGTVPLVILIHGGSWQAQVGADSFVTFSRRLAERGLAVYNLEYRRVGSGGGWPTTFEDVAAALDFVPQVRAGIPEIDTRDAVVVGHSAGGQLAMWAGTRHKLEADEVGASPTFRPTSVVSLAGPLDMRTAVRLGDDRIVKAVGGQPDQVPDRYRSVDPIQNIDPKTPIIAMVGTNDHVVPAILSQNYVNAVVREGGNGKVVLLGGADHVSIVTPSATTFPLVVETISRAAHTAHRG